MKFKTFYESTTPTELPFAVFIVAPTEGGYAATTRAADRGEAGRVGLPGGKVDPGERPEEAAIRESREEGWEVVGVDPTPIHKDVVEGKPVWWFKAESASPLQDYKEKSRGILPIVLPLADIAKSGYGNDFLSHMTEDSQSVRIFRAQPTHTNVIRKDDYVTKLLKFAVEHAESNHICTDEEHAVVTAVVPSSAIRDATNNGEYLSNVDVEGEQIYVTKGYDYEGWDDALAKDPILRKFRRG